jgi:hypothetical protein
MKKISLVIFLALVLTSCATIFSSKTQNISLIPTNSSEPVEVEVSNGKIMQNTKIPSTIFVPRANQNLIIKVKESSCYKTSSSVHESRLNFVTLLNIFGGWFSTSSTTTDSATGALWSYDDNIMVNTQKKDDCKK